MTAHVAIYGRLGHDPRSIDTRSGTAMVVGSLAVDVGGGSEEGDAAPEWFGVVAFGGQAEKLLKHGKGECLSASGRLQRRTYTDRNGEQRVQLQVVADAIVSARTVRPGGGKRKQHDEQQSAPEGAQQPQGERAPTGEDFDDEIPF